MAQSDIVFEEIKDGFGMASPIRRQSPDIRIEEIDNESICEFEFISSYSSAQTQQRESDLVFEEGSINSDSIMSIKCSVSNFEGPKHKAKQLQSGVKVRVQQRNRGFPKLYKNYIMPIYKAVNCKAD